MSHSDPKIGDVFLTDVLAFQAGTIKADPGSKLVTIFLGTMAQEADGDVPERLEKLGWTRSVVYEVASRFTDGVQDWVNVLNFVAPTPREAALAGIRFARRLLVEERKEGGEVVNLQSINIRVMKLGMIDADGNPGNERGMVFLSWNWSNEGLDEFMTKIGEM